MGRTGPDWSSWGRLERFFAQYDVSEVAARLSEYFSPHREGKWLALETFRAGVANWGLYGVGTGNEQVLSCQYSRIGGASLALITGDAVANYSWARKLYPFPYEGHCGVEFIWAGNGVTQQVSMKVLRYNGTVLERYGILMDLEYERIQSLRYDNTWENWLEGQIIENDPTAWNACKLVMDFDNDSYERFFLNSIEHEITTEQESVSSPDVAPGITVTIQATTRDTTNAIVYLDAVLVTEKERGWT